MTRATSGSRLRAGVAAVVAAAAAVVIIVATASGSSTNPPEVTTIGDATFSTVRPAWDPSVECVRVAGPMFRHEPNQTTGTCVSPVVLATEGLIQTYQVNDGPVLIYGLAPPAVTDILVDGMPAGGREGRFFLVLDKEPTSRMSITFRGRDGERTHVVEPAIPTSRYPVPSLSSEDPAGTTREQQ